MSLHRKRFWLLLAYVIAALPFILFGAMKAMNSNANSPIDWVPSSFPPRRDYDLFREQFGPGDVVVLSWPECRIDNSKVDDFVYSLRTDPLFRNESDRCYFASVASGRETAANLSQPTAGISQQDAVTRLTGTLVGPDELTTCVIVTFSEEGLTLRSHLVDLIRQAVRVHCDVTYDQLHLAGPVIDGLTVDRVSKRALDMFAIPSTLVVFYVCYVCLDSIRGALLVLAISLLGQATTLSLVHYSGDEMSALLIVMPPLIQVLAVAGGIHLVNYYAEASQTLGHVQAATHALRQGWLPCVLSAGTTALGLASLMASELTPIRAFGAYASSGVLLTTGLLLALVPGTLLVFSIPIMVKEKEQPASTGNSNKAILAITGKNGSWEWLTNCLLRNNGLIVLTAFIMMGLVGWGVSRAKSSVRIETLFAPNSAILGDYEWIEQHVGPLVPIEILLKFDKTCEMPFAHRLALANRVERTLGSLGSIRSTMSSNTFLPSVELLANPPSIDPRNRQRQIHQQWEGIRQTLADVNYRATVEDGELLRITAYMSALDDIDYGVVIEELHRVIAPELCDSELQPITGLSVRLTGIMPLVHEIQRQLMRDLLKSFVSAVFLITLVMTLVHGSVAAGMITMVSNLFPILLMFGGLGWLGVPMDIGSVMTASVALGIAVDDTLHYLTFYRRGLDLGYSRSGAVTFAFRHCGRAMMQTSFACGLGLLVFGFSDFVPTSRFACMMFGLLMMALLADLILLPSLLLGPLGNVFDVPETARTPWSRETDKLSSDGSSNQIVINSEGATVSPEITSFESSNTEGI